jgi:hypothetical protein
VEHIPVTIDSDDKKAWVVGKVPPHVFNALTDLPGRKRYVNGTAFFEMTRMNLEHLDLRLQNVTWQGPVRSLIEQFRAMRVAEKEARDQRFFGSPEVTEFPFKKKPYDHQLKAFALARGKPAFGYFMEQGTGKTKVLLDDAADIYLNGGENGRIDTLIIIAPNGVHAQWVNEQIPEHLTNSVPYAGGYTVAAPTYEEHSRWVKALHYREGLRILAIHIDMMSHKAGEELLGEILRSSKSMLVVDESSRIKDSSSKRTKTICRLGKLAKYRRILTGTPISQGTEDIYSQFFFLDPHILGFSSFYGFRNHFCRLKQVEVGQGPKKRKFSKIVGYINEDELKRKIDSYTFRVLKDECLDLPERNFIRQEVLLTPEQQELYEDMKKNFFLDLESGLLTARLAITRLIRFQQLIGGFVWKHAKKNEEGIVVEPEIYQEFPNNRVSRTLDIIQEARGKVIVWVKFHGDHRLLTKALDAAKIRWVDYVGITPQEQRAKNIDAFRNDPSVKVFLSSPKTGGVGLNLTAASEVIWYSRDFSLEAELQANDRCHRIGQHSVVNYHYLISPKTIDERIDTVLRNKKSVAENLIDIRDLFADD